MRLLLLRGSEEKPEEGEDGGCSDSQPMNTDEQYMCLKVDSTNVTKSSQINCKQFIRGVIQI